MRLRLTPAELRKLTGLASEDKSVSDFVRKQVFGRRSEVAFSVARIHSVILEIGRSVSERVDSSQALQSLAHLVAIERRLGELLILQKS